MAVIFSEPTTGAHTLIEYLHAWTEERREGGREGGRKERRKIKNERKKGKEGEKE